jgi:hypothetical protein
MLATIAATTLTVADIEGGTLVVGSTIIAANVAGTAITH